MKAEIFEARSAYLRNYDKPPTILFISPEAHTTLCKIATNMYLNKQVKSLVGGKFFGMSVHLVPTLETGFYVT